MRTSPIVKGGGPVTDEQLAAINRYTLRPLGAQEVFVFSIVLCDNQVDRDFERFPKASLQRLGELYLGRTGVFDHAPKAENQSARIFETRLEEGGGEAGGEEPYCALKAWAYMVRCPKNDDLILEIDAGIKKEVSVGCAVGHIRCSVCGADQREGGCEHRKGERCGDQVCHHLLLDPTDAYEWSFVAVPAQKRAGVVKRLGDPPREDDGAVAVSKARLAHLTRLAEAGGRYERQLRGEVVKLGLLAQPELSQQVLHTIADRLDLEELEALKTCYGQAAAARYPLSPQTGRPGRPAQADGGAYSI